MVNQVTVAELKVWRMPEAVDLYHSEGVYASS